MTVLLLAHPLLMIFPEWLEALLDLAPAFLIMAGLITAWWWSLRPIRHACALGLEGIVSKRLDKPYSSGRCHHWRKVKNPSYVRS